METLGIVKAALVVMGLAFLVTGTNTQQGRTLQVISVLEAPYLFQTNNSGDVEYSGYIKDLLDKLSTYLNVTYELSIHESYGRLDPRSGEWGGLIGELIKRKFDMAAGPITETFTRAHVVDFGTVFQTTSRVAIVKKHQPVIVASPGLDIRLTRLMSPIADSIWLMSGLAWFMSSLVLYVICRFNPYEWRRMYKHQEATLREGESFNCVNSFWFMMATFFWQGFMRTPRSMGARIVVTFWWLYALIFVAMYIASLSNFLQQGQNSGVFHKRQRPIRSIVDIIDNPDYRVGAIDSSATASFLYTSRDLIYNKLWKRMEGNPNSFQKTLEEGVEKVRKSSEKEPFAFIAESRVAKYYATQSPCDLFMLRDFPEAGSYAFAYPIKSDMKTVVDFAVLRLKENGIMAYLERKWFTGGCKDYYSDNTDAMAGEEPLPFHEVDLGTFSGALILLAIGLVGGSLVTLLEVFLFRYAEKDRQEELEERRLMRDQTNDKGKHTLSPESAQPTTVV